ncbi:hypothetical protein PCANC_00389 [Puccinia coronata f. sp. avenae]|uniref:Homoserine dehydrogenase n=1 Tax=Puccinia coronata f. sp. avenae TaxID=200324 RepID=A0A2N5VQ02_9BASI|nr:hypothetical protein PCASD_02025 [Puccinia coronata f. sp. avenae]PLW58795.1 hypothetical protein PCANC_00389 [Puccinia coronata f. sp. avenae]
MAAKLPIHVAIVGVGLVGEQVVHQLMAPRLRSSFRICSLHTSRRHLEVTESLAEKTAAELIEHLKNDQSTSSAYSGGAEDVVGYLTDPSKLPRPLLVVDCTSSQPFAEAYPRILASDHTHLVTPNKKAFSGSEALNSAIEKTLQETGNLVFKEATVGAGLPIISTLRELVITGDELTKIEGIFSGTMSYIFNQYSPTTPTSTSFSEVVSVAKKMGYTEPNPADDLNGSDVARKLCILARNLSSPISLPQGFESVPTHTLIPPPLVPVTDPAEFMATLPQFDAQFGRFRDEAFTLGEVMRYVGVIDLTDPAKPLVKAGLERYPFNHPFATMKGSDNIISFHSKRYASTPLIVQGSGAGAEVTAMGVVGDMIKVAERLSFDICAVIILKSWQIRIAILIQHPHHPYQKKTVPANQVPACTLQLPMNGTRHTPLRNIAEHPLTALKRNTR